MKLHGKAFCGKTKKELAKKQISPKPNYTRRFNTDSCFAYSLLNCMEKTLFGEAAFGDNFIWCNCIWRNLNFVLPQIVFFKIYANKLYNNFLISVRDIAFQFSVSLLSVCSDLSF